MSAFIFGNLSIRKENRSGASLRPSSDMTHHQINLNDEPDSHASEIPKHTGQSGDICKKQKTGADISDICRKGPYNAGPRAGSRLKALRRSDPSKKKHKYLPVGRAHREKYAMLRKRQKERLSNRETRSLQTLPLFPESHREDLMGFKNQQQARSVQTLPLFPQSHTEVHMGFKTQQQTWSCEELDSLWKGVRRHGMRNWEAMLRDQELTFSRFKTAEDLEARWNREDLISSFPCLNGLLE